MMTCDERSFEFGRTLLPGLLVVVVAAALAMFAVGCGGDTGQTGATGCTDHFDCDFGEVCNDDAQCVDGVECQWCQEEIEQGELICYDGYCTRPECSDDSDCDGDDRCIDGVCAEAQPCSSSDDCPDGYRCTLAGYCTKDDDNGGNGGDPDCTGDEDCPGDEVCEDGTCIDDGDNGETCDLEPADCVDPEPHFDEQACECAECLDETDCDGANEQCINGSCTPAGSEDCPSGIECDPNNPGTCGGDTPYCIDECCVECIGAGDCDGNELCVDGQCQDSAGCEDDGDCPSGYDCSASGECVPPETGEDCSTDADCPDGQFCDPQTNTCQSLGGDMGCGFCNDDCTCDNGLTCDGFMCTGCAWLTEDDCPDDQWCYPAADFEMADENFCGPQLM